MAVTLAYDDTVSRVVVNANGMTGATTATVERSLNQIQWTTVRGGTDVTVTAGAFPLPVYDYEFVPDVVNYYRVTPNQQTVASDPFTRVVVNGWGTEPVTGLTYALDGAVGDFDVGGSTGTIGPTVSADDSAAVVDVNTSNVVSQAKFNLNTLPASATFDFGLIGRGTDDGNRYIAKARVATTGVVTLVAHKRVGGVQTDFATILAGVTLVVATQYTLKTEISGTAPTVFRAKMWKTSDPEPAGWTLNTTDVSGSPPASGELAGVFARNNSATLSRVITVDDLLVYNLTPAGQTGSITPTLTDVWLKSISRPFLNQPVQVLFGPSHVVTRPARVGVFDIVGRTLPVAVSDVRTSRRWTLRLLTETDEAADLLDLILASGDVLFFQAPAACIDLISCYIAIDDATRENHPLRVHKIQWRLACTEVAAPAASVVGSTVVWASVIAAYADWQAVIADHADWASLLTIIGSPSDVIVP